MQQIKISLDDALEIMNNDESHFMDFKGKQIKGSKLQITVTAFANSDGGEIYVGIEDEKTAVPKLIDRWKGFNNQEEANSLTQTISCDISPSPPIDFEFYEIDGLNNGLILKIMVNKSSEIHYTSDKNVYVRKGAQNLPLIGEDVVNLKLSKGLISYEDQIISGVSTEEITESEELSFFLEKYSPKTQPIDFLKKQRIIRREGENFKPTVAGVLLYSDNPSAIISKKCAVKISRYDTSELEPHRQHLKEQYTIEGPINKQIEESLEKIQSTIESMSILGKSGLEKPKYPIDAIKEILVNALIHRDYNISDDILVFIYNNRIEIKNPGRLPGHITVENILEERFARNSTIVRLLNKYPNPPNKDIGEGLNTAFQSMREMKLKPPRIEISDNAVIVKLPHEPIASPEETILEYLLSHEEINNRTARKLSGITSENTMKDIFYKMRDTGLIERVPGKKGPASSWRKK